MLKNTNKDINYMNQTRSVFLSINLELITKVVTAFLILGIGILLFTQHIMFSSANKSLTQKFEFNDENWSLILDQYDFLAFFI